MVEIYWNWFDMARNSLKLLEIYGIAGNGDDNDHENDRDNDDDDDDDEEESNGIFGCLLFTCKHAHVLRHKPSPV